MKFFIREARENAGYTQRELAEIIGVAPNTIHGYESGKHDPKSDLLTQISKACHVSVDYLLGLSSDPTPSYPVYSSDNNITPQERKIALAYRQANADDRAVVEITLKKYMSADDGEKSEIAIG